MGNEGSSDNTLDLQFQTSGSTSKWNSNSRTRSTEGNRLREPSSHSSHSGAGAASAATAIPGAPEFPRASITDIVWVFWKDYVDILPRKKQLEVAVVLYTNMFTNIPDARRLFLRNDLKEQSLKYLDMLGWLIRRIKTGDKDSLQASIGRLGDRHAAWGVHAEYFLPMLIALHGTLAASFPEAYTVRVKYCMEKVFWAAATIMTGQTFGSRVSSLDTLSFTESLDVCLSTRIGREYLSRFLSHCFRGELIDFHLAFKRFRGSVNSLERNQTANEIMMRFVRADGRQFLADCPVEVLQRIERTLAKCERKSQPVPEGLFDALHGWVREVIEQDSWPQFVTTLQSIAD